MMKSQQLGFSTVGVMIAIIVASIFGLAATSGLIGQLKNNRYSAAKIDITDNLPRAIFGYTQTIAGTNRLRRQNYNITSLLTRSGVNPETPFGRKWQARVSLNSDTVSQVGTTDVVVTYPLSSSDKQSNNEFIAELKKLADYDRGGSLLVHVEQKGDSAELTYRPAN